MKKTYILFISFLLVNFQASFAQTPVSGGIYSNTTWTLANSPYLMTGSIVVFPGVTLNIEPGVEVRVKENGLTGGQYYLETRGLISYAIFDTTCANVITMVIKTIPTAVNQYLAAREINMFPNPATTGLTFHDCRQGTIFAG